MSAIFFRTLDLRSPGHHLGIGSGPHGRQTGRMLEAIESVLIQERPDAVLVYGDTNSTLAGALAASKALIPVAHIESGLRSYNRNMPEETNRVVTDHISTLLFCPSEHSARTLKGEGITAGVHVVGDVMKDALLFWQSVEAKTEHRLEDFGLRSGSYYLATVHRAENVDDPARLNSIVQGLGRLDRPVVMPVHPRTRAVMRRLNIEAIDGVQLIDPVGYLDMLQLERNAKAILTDSGGIQKEAYLLGVLCVTMRDETEWLETVENGWNVLVGADSDRIVEAACRYSPPAVRPELYGDGRASLRIAGVLGQLSA